MRVIILNLVRLVLEDSSISNFLLFIGVSLQLGVQPIILRKRLIIPIGLHQVVSSMICYAPFVGVSYS